MHYSPYSNDEDDDENDGDGDGENDDDDDHDDDDHDYDYDDGEDVIPVTCHTYLLLINFYIVRYIDSDAAVSPFTGHQSIEDNIKRWEDEGNLGGKQTYLSYSTRGNKTYLYTTITSTTSTTTSSITTTTSSTITINFITTTTTSTISATQVILFVVINTFPNQVIIIYHINCHRHNMNSLFIAPIYILSSHFLS